MAYERNNLVSRPGYAGTEVMEAMGDWWDSIENVAGGVLKFYGTAEQAQGAAQATAQTNRDLAAALAANQGMSTSTLLLLGAAGLAAVLILKRKS